MKWAIFSDIQGNLRALEQFFANVNADRFYCLGDIVQHGKTFDENRVVDLLIERKVLCVAGNHDSGLVTKFRASPDRFPLILPETVEYLGALGDELTNIIIPGRNIHLSHYGHSMSQRVFTTQEALSEFEVMVERGIRIAFLGHSHKQFVFSREGNGRILEEQLGKPVILRDKKTYLVNPGTLGAYGDVQHTYATFDPQRGVVEIKQLQ